MRLLALAIALTIGVAHADVQLQAQIASPIAVGQTTDLSVVATGAQNVAAPSIPPVDGLQIRYYGPETQVSFVNGAMSASMTHHYRVTALRPGDFTIGPITVDVGGRTITAAAVVLQVQPGGTAANAPTGAAAAPAPARPGGNQLKLTIETPRTDVYLHEQIPVTVRLMVGAVRVADLQYPQLPGDGFAVDKFPEPAQRQERTPDGVFQVVEFKTTLTPLRTGSVTVGPATAQLALVSGRRRSLFDDGVEPMQLASEPLVLNVLPIPDAGRPAGYTGAVGQLDFDLAAAPTQLAAGDPVTVTMTISGHGDLSQVKPPEIAASDAFKTYPVQPGAADATKRTFEQVVIPQHDGAQQIGPLTFSWFDPAAGGYRSVTRGPIALTVRPAAGGKAEIVGEKPAATTAEPEQLGRDIVSIKDDPGTLRPIGARRWRSPLFWIWQPVPLLLWLAARTWAARRDRERGDERRQRFVAAGRTAKTALADARAALANGDRAAVHDRAANAVRDYLTAKLDLPPGAVSAAAVRERLTARRADVAVADLVDEFLAVTEQARFAPTAAADAETTLTRADTIVRTIEKLRGLALSLLLVFVAAGVAIAAADGAQTIFFRANTLYGESRWADAAAEYEKIPGSGVESAPVQFNLGNAYFKAGDIGRTILAYERARTLAPGDPDLRANLAFAREQSGDPDPTPVWVQILLPLADRAATDTLLLLASVLMTVTFVVLAAGRLWPPAQRAALVNAGAVGVVALLIGVSAGWRLATVDWPAYAVVLAAGTTPVRFEPQPAGTVHFEAKAGAVLQVVGDREGWRQVERGDGRRGWIPADAIALR